MEHKWEINIGDWSGDGHSQSETKLIASNLSVQQAREAYFAATEKLGKCYPEVVCHDYEDYTVTADMLAELRLLGFEFKDCDSEGEIGGDDEVVYPHADGMLQLTIWFITQGNPEFRAVSLNHDTECLNFYGFDGKQRHIGFIGYGVFGS